jgi:hypothetical protein
MSQIIDSGAALLAESRHNHDRAIADLAKATEHRDAVQARIVALGAKRSEIAARRAAGKGDDLADGAALQIVALDLEGLTNDLLPAAEAEVKAATANVQRAAVQVSTAERRLARTEDEATLAALVPHLGALADKLYATLVEVKALNGRLGQRDCWAPSHALQQELRRLEHSVFIARPA